MKEYTVTLNGELIDSIFFVVEEDPEAVKKSLIEHDGYDHAIAVELKS